MDYTNSQIRALIAEHIHSTRDREILEKRLVDGYTFDMLSAEFSMSQRQIRRIVYNLQVKLFKHLKPPD